MLIKVCKKHEQERQQHGSGTDRSDKSDFITVSYPQMPERKAIIGADLLLEADCRFQEVTIRFGLIGCISLAWIALMSWRRKWFQLADE